MILKRDLIFFASITKVADIRVNLRQSGQVIVGLEPPLGDRSNVERLIVLPHHVQRGDESQPCPGGLLPGSRAFEQRDRLLIVINRLIVLLVGVQRVRHQAARLGQRDTVICL